MEKGSISPNDLCIIMLQALYVAVDSIHIYRLTSGLLPALASNDRTNAYTDARTHERTTALFNSQVLTI